MISSIYVLSGSLLYLAQIILKQLKIFKQGHFLNKLILKVAEILVYSFAATRNVFDLNKEVMFSISRTFHPLLTPVLTSCQFPGTQQCWACWSLCWMDLSLLCPVLILRTQEELSTPAPGWHASYTVSATQHIPQHNLAEPPEPGKESFFLFSRNSEV